MARPSSRLRLSSQSRISIRRRSVSLVSGMFESKGFLKSSSSMGGLHVRGETTGGTSGFNQVDVIGSIMRGALSPSSEFTLRQICKRLEIPTPPRGHFNHIDPKNRMQRPALPPALSRNPRYP
jgi:hypothetical protein